MAARILISGVGALELHPQHDATNRCVQVKCDVTTPMGMRFQRTAPMSPAAVRSFAAELLHAADLAEGR